MKARKNTITEEIMYLVAETEQEEEILRWMWDKKAVVSGRGPKEVSLTSEEFWGSGIRKK